MALRSSVIADAPRKVSKDSSSELGRVENEVTLWARTVSLAIRSLQNAQPAAAAAPVAASTPAAAAATVINPPSLPPTPAPPLDKNLLAIAALIGAGFLQKTVEGVWRFNTNVATKDDLAGIGGGTPGANSILFTQIQKIPGMTILGNDSESSGDIMELTIPEILGMLASTDVALGGGSPSDLLVPTQKAVKAYADQLLAASEAMIFKGVLNCSGNPDYPAATAGWVYKISVAGRIGGVSGPKVEVGDTVYCITTNVGGTDASVGMDFVIVQANIDGYVIGPASAVDLRVVVFDGATGKLIKDGGILLSALLQAGLITGSGLTMSNNRLLGRWDAGTGALEEVQLGTNLSLAGGFLSAASAGATLDIRDVWLFE